MTLNILTSIIPAVLFIVYLQIISGKKQWALRNGTEQENIKANKIRQQYGLYSFISMIGYITVLIILNHFNIVTIITN